MLYDPRWAKQPRPPSFSEPSLEGFALFVALRMLADPDGEYDWTNTWDCAGGQYLRSLGLWTPNWNERPDYILFEVLACGRARDRRGRFTHDVKEAVWRWRDLHKRLRHMKKEGELCLVEAA